MPFLRALWKKILEPPFISIFAGLAQLVFILGLFVVALRVNASVQAVWAATGVYVWPKDGVGRFNWFLFWGKPWTALLLGICAGAIQDRFIVTRLDGPQDAMLRDAIARALDRKFKRENSAYVWLILSLVIIVGPNFLLPFFFHVSGAIYSYTAISVEWLVQCPRRRRTYHDMINYFDTTPLTDDERERFQRFLQKERKIVRRFATLVPLWIIFVATCTVFASRHVANVMSDVEADILARHRAEQAHIRVEKAREMKLKAVSNQGIP